MIRAVDDQDVMPITTTITRSPTRIPKTSVVPPPRTSRMIDVRMIARTNVGMHEEEVGDAHEQRVDPAADEPADDPDDDADERR